MDKDIYYESVNISYKTVQQFEEMYNSEKEKIIIDLKNILKEKYNIDINGSKEDVKHIKATCNNSSTSI